MKRFVFRLQRVLDYRTQVEEAEKLELQRLLGQRQRIRQQDADLEGAGRESRRAWRLRTRVFPHEIRIFRNYLAHLEVQRGRLELRARELDGKILRQRNRLTQATRQRELLARLKGRRLQRHRKELDRFEQQQVDELFMARLVRAGATPAGE